ncbi:MAG: ThiF family adenylyltransferase [Clostridia bacterium]|nr:ThiF family adenylyltransferase [Clostridia bacterium]
MFSRTELLLGDQLKKLRNAKVIVFGVGGVGGYAVEMLVRSGVENITIVDFDKVDVTNKNRQIIALDSTIGQYKVDVLQSRIKDINSNCSVVALNKKLEPNNIDSFDLKNFDYVVDAIDMVTSKVALIEYCKINNIPIISAMGVGNRVGIPDLAITDIYNTNNDGLAKVLRKKLREKDVSSHNVVFCRNNSTSCGDTIGSISYFPAMSGCLLASFVINELIKGDCNGCRN